MISTASRRPAWRYAGYVTALLTAAVLAACGGSTSSKHPTAAATKSTVSTFGTAAGEVDHLNWGLPYGEPNTIDPPNTAYYSSAFVAENLCDDLLKLNPDYSITPNLASFSQPDPLTVVFTLKPGVHFWDGTTMTADDAVWSLKHAASPTSVVGFLFASVSSIEKTGALQVTIKFKTADSLFVPEMATFAGAVQEASFSAKAGSKLGSAKGGLMCTGPYKLGSWVPGSKIELTANDDYWNSAAKPHAKAVTISFVTDSSSLAQALAGGQLDGAYEIPASAIPRLATATPTGNLVFGSPSQLFLTVSVLQKTGVLANPDVRKALWMTIDRKALATVVYHGAATPNYTSLNVSSWQNGSIPPAAQKIWADAYAGFESQRSAWGSPSAIAAAKALAAKAGYTGQPIVMATLAGDATSSQTAQLMQAEAKQAGINLVIKPLQAIEFSNAGVDPKARQGLDLMLGVSFNGAPNPLELMGFDYLPGSFYNYTGYDNSVVDSSFAKAKASLDPVEQARLLTTAQAEYEQDYSSATLVQIDEIMFLKKGLGGAITSFAYLNNPALASIGKD